MFYNDKISVVIPVYNVEPYIRKSLNSIISQTYKNIEIFLVDDGSTDNSGKICNEYALKDNRVHVIHKKNGGQGSARNMALDACTGDYICFLDSDDFVDDDYILFLLDFLKKYDLDIACCNYRICSEKGSFIRNRHKGSGIKFFSNTEAISSLWYNDTLNIGPWGKIYKRALWNDIRFKECYAEDYATMHNVFIKATKIGYSYECKLNYVSRNNSSLRSSFNDKKFVILDIAKETIDFSQKYPELIKPAFSKAVSSYFHILFQLQEDGYEDEKSKIIEFIKQNRLGVLFDIKSNMKIKFAILLSFFSFGLANRIFNTFCKK